MTPDIIIVDYIGGPAVTPGEHEILNGLRIYFAEIGCHVQPRPKLAEMTTPEMMRALNKPLLVVLPYSQDAWAIEIEGDTINCWMDQSRDGTQRATVPVFKIPVSDPQSLPKLVAYMQRKSKFLRGGLRNEIPKVEA